jgi:MFS family permease
MNMNIKDGYRWVILGLLTFCVVIYGIIFQSIPPILTILIHTFNISYTQAGALMSLFTLPKIFFSLPGGILIDRYGAKILGIASLLTMAFGTAVTATGSYYWVLGLGRLLAGIGAACLVVVGLKSITSWFYGREIGLSMGVFNLSLPLGTILSLNFMGLIAHQFHWRVSIMACLVMSLMALGLFLGLFRNINEGEKMRANPSGLLTVMKEAGWGIWCVGFSWGLFNAGLISFFTYAPDYFVNQGMDIAKAGLLASYPMWSSIILGPIFGMLIDRVGHKWLFVSVGCGGMAILLYLIPMVTTHVTFLTILIGVSVALVSPAIFSFPAELLPEPIIGFGFGIVGTNLGIGISLGPYIAGMLRDATGNYIWSFVAMATFTALGIIPILFLKRQTNKTLRVN